MGKRLVIAEKPSVAQTLAKVIGAYARHDGYLEGSGYVVSWCVGHLVGLAQPDQYDDKYRKWNYADLPIIPEKWKTFVSPDKQGQFSVLKELMKREDVEELICATDAGREGELIFRLVYHQAGCRKPFKRLWISSMEDAAIREGFAHLKEGRDYDRLYDAAVCRQKADWLVGMNATRLFSVQYGSRLTVGRVQTPTLAMLVERSGQISNFRKEKYYNLHLDCDGMLVQKEKIFDKAEADKLLDKCNGNSAEVVSVKKQEKTINPPRLYDLTTLQRESNRYYGYTAQETLDYTQSLYEKKLVTYPRTDSQFLTEDMAGSAESMIKLVKGTFPFAVAFSFVPDVSRLIDNSKVTDHHAIIPTAEIAKQNLSSLTQGERDILNLTAMRLLAASAEKHRYLETEVTVCCAGEEFSTRGKTILEDGWKAVEAAYRTQLKEKPADTLDRMLLDVAEGQTFEAVRASLTEHYTAPPKAYTEDTLLSAMETAGNESFDADTEKKGLGTPATRASMIEKLVRSKYIERKGKQLIPTEAGIRLMGILPDKVKSPKLTAEWENILMQIERGEASGQDFLAGIENYIRSLVEEYAEVPAEVRAQFSRPQQKEQIGACPRCGSPVYEGQKNFYCSSRECSFCIWKDSKWLSGMKKKINKKSAESLLKTGRVKMTGLYSVKTGKSFDATLVLDDTGRYVNFKLEFDKDRKGGNESR